MSVSTSNDELADLFRLISSLYISVSKDKAKKYKSEIFAKAAAAIESYPKEIISGAEFSASTPGSGKSVAEAIDEYLTTGKITRLDELEALEPERTKTIRLYTGVFGIGTVKANTLYESGYKTLEDLLYAPLTSAQKWGLYYYYHFKENIPRSEIDIYYTRVKKLFDTYFPNVIWEIGGSYRRGSPSSGDIDIAIKQTPGLTLDTIIDKLTRDELLVGTLSMGEHKFLGIGKLDDNSIARRVDVFLYPEHEWVYALLHVTGSGQFNKLLRKRAIEFGLTLSEKGMHVEGTNQWYPANTEEDVFNYLRVYYLTPEQRTKKINYLQTY